MEDFVRIVADPLKGTLASLILRESLSTTKNGANGFEGNEPGQTTPNRLGYSRLALMTNAALRRNLMARRLASCI